MIPAASLAASVPSNPIAIPTSAFFKAGASLAPSPVTATIWPHYIKPVTSMNLSSGVDLANTFSSAAIPLNFCKFCNFALVTDFVGSSPLNYKSPINFLNSCPSNTE